jgi:hypothetical protein
MAGLLFEYAIPGMTQRSLLFPQPTTLMNDINNNNATTMMIQQQQQQQQSSTTIPRTSTRYKKIEKLFLRFETMYSEPAFEEYIQQFHHGVPSSACVLADNNTNNYVPGTQLVSTTPKEIPFSALAREYRCSYNIFEWMHKGKTAWLMGNRRRRRRRRRAAHLWILACQRRGATGLFVEY